MRYCLPERPKFPDRWRRRIWRAIPHKFKATKHGRNMCDRCNRLNYRKVVRPSDS